MAKKNEFRPDRPHANWLSKLYLTPQQRKNLLKWVLYGLALLVLSLVQDVILSGVRIFGASTDLVPCGIFLICLLEGSHTGSVFTLVASCLFVFSGSAPGNYCIVLITFLAIAVTLFRQAFLQKGFFTTVLCGSLGVIAYELLLFVIGAVLEYTLWGRFPAFFLTGVLSTLVLPILYPICTAIGAIGGSLWKE